jgi:hypothetical protein
MTRSNLMKAKTVLVFVVSCLWMALLPAVAADWRISVKLILGPESEVPVYGNPNAGDSFQNVAATMDQLNIWLQVFDTPYQFDLIEVLALQGLETYFDAEVDAGTRDGLEASALADPALYGWRDDAINVYINGNTDGTFVGYCSIAGTDHHAILLRQDASDATFFHELGHYFSLWHTHQGSDYIPGEGCEGIHAPGNGDYCEDTLPDVPCYERDDIAAHSYGEGYDGLTPAQQELVDNTWYNLMSYHHAGVQVTPDQWDRVAEATAGERLNVSAARDWFVDLDNNCDGPTGGRVCGYTGTSWIGLLQAGGGPFPTVAQALDEAQSGDRLRIRPGTYAETLTIDQAVTLTADGGPALLR